MLSRYFSPAQLARIRSTRIGIAGLGGLGSNCGLVLARCGFEKFTVADFDKVEFSNLNRQIYFPEHAGRQKTVCFSETLLKLNPGIDIEAHPVILDRSNVRTIFRNCDVVIEAFDKPECKAMIIEAFLGSVKLLVGASGLAGYGSSDRIVVRKIRDRFYLVGDEVSEVSDSAKPYAPCVSIAAAKEADVVLDWVLSQS